MRLGLGLGLGVGAAPVPPPPWAPTDLGAHLKLWLRGDLGITLTSGKVSKWADQSGSGIGDWNQTNAAIRPQNAGGSLGGKAAVTFVLASLQNLIGPSYSSLPAGHFFFVLKAASSTEGGQLENFGSAATGDYYPYVDGSGYLSCGAIGRAAIGTLPVLADTEHLLEVISVGANFTVKQNGTQIFTFGGSTVGWDATGSVLGAGTGAPGVTPTGAWGGVIAEILLADRQVTGSDLTSLKAYITARYGIALS